MDGRVKPGHDEFQRIVSRTRCGVLHAAAQSRDRRVGKAVGREACDGVPTIGQRIRIKMVGTAQERLCPPYRLYATSCLLFSARLRSLASRNFLRKRIDFGVTSTSSSSSI